MMRSRKIKLSTQDEIIDFLDLCERLSKIIENENENLLNDHPYAPDRMAFKRVVMLKDFERETSKIFKKVQDELSHDLALQGYLIDVVKTLQDKLKINTGLHLHMMVAAPEFALREGGRCH